MKYQPPFVPGATPGAEGIYNPDPDASYVNGNPSLGQEGSYFPGEALEHTQREIVAQIATAGLTPVHWRLTQLRDSIARSASGATWLACTGSANAYTLVATGAFTVPGAPFLGQLVRFVPNHTNNGAATATFAGVTKAIRAWDGAALVGGELISGKPVEAFYDPSADGAAGALRLTPWSAGNQTLNEIINYKPSGFSATSAGGSTTIPTGVSTKLTHISNLSRSFFRDGGSSFASSRFTCGAADAGLWLFSCNAALGSASGTGVIRIAVAKNNTQGPFKSTYANGSGTFGIAAPQAFVLAATDYVEMFLFQNIDTTRDVEAVEFTGVRLGAN